MAHSGESARQIVYDGLGEYFRSIEAQLDANGKTDLDGRLWALAEQLARAGVSEWPPKISTVGEKEEAVGGGVKPGGHKVYGEGSTSPPEFFLKLIQRRRR